MDESTTAPPLRLKNQARKGLGLRINPGYQILTLPSVAGPQRPGQEARGDGVTTRGLRQAEEVQVVTGYDVHIREAPASPWYWQPRVTDAVLMYLQHYPHTVAGRSINITHYKIRLDAE